MKNYDWCEYTYKHRRMFEYIAKKLIKNDYLIYIKWCQNDKVKVFL